MNSKKTFGLLIATAMTAAFSDGKLYGNDAKGLRLYGDKDLGRLIADKIAETAELRLGKDFTFKVTAKKLVLKANDNKIVTKLLSAVDTNIQVSKDTSVFDGLTAVLSKEAFMAITKQTIGEIDESVSTATEITLSDTQWHSICDEFVAASHDNTSIGTMPGKSVNEQPARQFADAEV